jgi:hypothetical protein
MTWSDAGMTIRGIFFDDNEEKYNNEDKMRLENAINIIA